MPLPSHLAALVALASSGAGLTFSSRALPRGCANLTNKGTHSVVDVLIGTPSQSLSLVVDTGSSNLIATSCVCHDIGGCKHSPRCFRGTNRSSSFSLTEPPVSLVLSFGSGTVLATPTTDVVQVGGIEARMADSLLLMTDAYLQGITGFEGILGMGLPTPPGATLGSDGDAEPQDLGDAIERSADAVLHREPELGFLGRAGRLRAAQPGPSDLGNFSAPRGFLESAGLARFSLCFTEGADGGALRLGLPPLEDPLGSVGEMHWALGFRGASAGNASVDSRFCQGNSTCKIIPDSGTTQILGPTEQVNALLESICDEWARCVKNHTKLLEATKAADEAIEKVYGANPLKVAELEGTKAQVLTWLLQDCGRWWEEAGGLGEIPSVQFHVQGAGSKDRLLELPAWAWVVERTQGGPTAATECAHMFGYMGMLSPGGGHWILGMPLFYQFVVQFDITTKLPSLDFRSGGCSPCPGGDTMLQTGAKERASSRTARARPRPGPLGPPRMPTNVAAFSHKI